MTCLGCVAISAALYRAPSLLPLSSSSISNPSTNRSASLLGARLNNFPQSKNSQDRAPPSTSFGSCRETARRSSVVTASATMRPQRSEPKEGQESVWDYPRPPRLERIAKHIVIKFNGEVIADTRDAYRVLETSHPPVYYIPQRDIRMQYVHKSPGSSFCEWKGSATYWTVAVGSKSAKNVGWSYESPTPGFTPMKSHIAFYCSSMDSCTVDGEKAEPQPGGFYGGWVTSDVVGPFKGGAGSWGW